MGVRGTTPLLSRFSTPATGLAKDSVLKNGDFRLDADADGMPDHWQFIANAERATCMVERVEPDSAHPCLRLACPVFGEKAKGGYNPKLRIAV
jgi:hypothetical protein